MKKVLLTIAVLLLGTSMYAQKEQRLLNSWSIGLNASTMGYGFDLSTTISPYLMLRTGIDLFPNSKADTDVDVYANGNQRITTNINGHFKRTQFNVLLNCYPFTQSSFFITGGAYFGGESIIDLDGQSDELKEIYEQYGDQANIIIDKYKLPIGKDGKVKGNVNVKKMRPYIGLGFGRIVPRNKRVGFMFELGAQFHGTPQVESEIGNINEILSNETEGDDDFSKIIRKLTVYPVLKFRLCGKII